LVAVFGSQKLAHWDLEQLLDFVTQEACGQGVDGQESSLQIVRAQKVVAVFDQVAVQVFACLTRVFGLSDRTILGRRFVILIVHLCAPRPRGCWDDGTDRLRD
jgi:hypothetical protein